MGQPLDQSCLPGSAPLSQEQGPEQALVPLTVSTVVSTSPWLPTNPAKLSSDSSLAVTCGSTREFSKALCSRPPPCASPSSPATSSDPYHTDSRTQCHGVPSCETSLHSPSRSTTGHGARQSQSDSHIGQTGRSAAGKAGVKGQGPWSLQDRAQHLALLQRGTRALKNIEVAVGGCTFSRSALRAWNPLRRVMSAIAMPDSPSLPLRLQEAGPAV